jgi:hypothetical protein
MGDATTNLFKSMKAKLGIHSAKSKDHEGHGPASKKHGSSDASGSSANKHSNRVQQAAGSRHVHERSHLKVSKSRENMLAMYRGML